MIAIILVFIDRYNFGDCIRYFSEMNTLSLILNIITTVLLIVSVIATIFSGYDYLKKGKDLFKDA